MADVIEQVYYPDKAIQSETSDLFNFNPTAKVLANNISKLSSNDSYTIAVNGEWGSGKSSFLNLVHQHLEHSDAPFLTEYYTVSQIPGNSSLFSIANRTNALLSAGRVTPFSRKSHPSTRIRESGFGW